MKPDAPGTTAGEGADGDDPPEAADVEALHRPLGRERGEPEEGRERAPWWVWTLAAVALFSGGFYLGRFGGDFSTTPHLGYAPRGIAAAPADLPVRTGEEIYRTSCASCHQLDGTGVPGAFPPMVGSEWLLGDPTPAILLVLHGLQGPITVAGEVYDGVMPAWKDQLSDAEIANVITFERKLAGAADPEVDPARVEALRQETAARAEPYTAAELEAAVKGR